MVNSQVMLYAVVAYAIVILSGLFAASVYSSYLLKGLSDNTEFLGCVQCALGNAEQSIVDWYNKQNPDDPITGGACGSKCNFA